jgi:hypothetical protein
MNNLAFLLVSYGYGSTFFLDKDIYARVIEEFLVLDAFSDFFEIIVSSIS